MKFLCPNCKAKYRIGPEKLKGRQVAKIRCRKCDYRINIARMGVTGDEFEITASPTSIAPPPPEEHAAAAVPKKPTAAVPGLPGLGASTATRGPRFGANGSAESPGGRSAGQSAAAGRDARSAAVGAAAPLADEFRRSVAQSQQQPGPPPPQQQPPRQAEALRREPRPAPARPPAAPRAAPRQPPAARKPAGPWAAGANGRDAGAAAPAAPPPRAGMSTAGGAGIASPPVAAPPGAPADAPPARPAAPVAADPSAPTAADEPLDGWFVGVNGVPLGPIPVGDLQELAAAGHIDRRSLVWREGFPEWRPLGKFPHLVSILDEGAADGAAAPEPAAPAPEAPPAAPALAAPAPAAPPPAAPPPAARPPGASPPPPPAPRPREAVARAEPAPVAPPAPHSNVEASEGPPFGSMPGGNQASSPISAQGSSPDAAAPPTEKQETSSPWENDEDDEDDQPTTVRGRVSAPPPGIGVPAAAAVQHPGGLMPPGPALGAVASFSAPPAPMSPSSTISTTPDPMAGLAPSSRRPNAKLVWVSVVLAVLVCSVVAYALGVSKSQRDVAPSPEKSGSASEPAAGSEEPPPEKKTSTDPPPEPAVEEASDPEKGGAEAEAAEGSSEEKSAKERARKHRRRNTKVAAQEVTEEPADSKPASLLEGLGGPRTPGPRSESGRKRASSGGGAGLDATAIQRTVARNSVSVRRSCWQPALAARAPGVPSSAKVSARVSIMNNGKVESVRVTGAPRGYPGLARCIESRVRGWRFPRAGGSTETQIPFMFVGQ